MHDVVGETAAPESPMRAPPRVIRLAGKRKIALDWISGVVQPLC
jgi:hypothetical protein